ncbi:MAG: methyltransferase [Pseudomonadota bacterium]
MTMKHLIVAASVFALAACVQADDEDVPNPETSQDVIGADVRVDTDAGLAGDVDMATDMDGDMDASDDAVIGYDAEALATILEAQDDAVKARYDARNPAGTLEFFGIAPGMAVGEALPGGGWYSKILLPYLGDEGRLVAVDYTIPMWGEFGFADDEFLAAKETWPETWVEDARGWTDSGADIEAYTFASLPQDASLDAFLFIRALHNLSRFNESGNYMGDALAAVHGSLKPGGMVGVVQHAGPDDADAEWAMGSNGYLKQADVVAAFEAAGFELVGESDVNANPADMPTTEDGVWRLPPNLATSREDEALRAQMEEIGESNRMTLLFRKAG